MWALDNFFKKHENKRNEDKVENMMAQAFTIEGNYTKIIGLFKILKDKLKDNHNYLDAIYSIDNDYYIYNKDFYDDTNSYGSVLKEYIDDYLTQYKKDRHKIKITGTYSSENETHYTVYLNIHNDQVIFDLVIKKMDNDMSISGKITEDHKIDRRDEVDELNENASFFSNIIITEEEYRKVRDEIINSKENVLSAFWL